MELIDLSSDFQSVKAFISHSSEDKDIAEKLIPVLRDGMVIREDCVRCTSIPQSGLDFDKSISDALRDDLEKTFVVFALLTEEGLASSWVKFELGAAWALRKLIITILGPGIEHEDLRLGPLSGPVHISIESNDAEDKLWKAISQSARLVDSQPIRTDSLKKEIADFVQSCRDLGGGTADFTDISASFHKKPELLLGSPNSVSGDIEIEGAIELGGDAYIWLCVHDPLEDRFWPKRPMPQGPGIFSFSFKEGGVLGPEDLALTLVGCGRSGNKRAENWIKNAGWKRPGDYDPLSLADFVKGKNLDSVQNFTIINKR